MQKPHKFKENKNVNIPQVKIGYEGGGESLTRPENPREYEKHEVWIKRPKLNKSANPALLIARASPG
jgi:hypothetical protein